MQFDYCFITGCFIVDIGSIKSLLHNVFSMTDHGLLKQFLGLEIQKYDEGIKVSQSMYTEHLILKFKMAERKAYKCTFLLRVKLGDFGSSPLVDNSLYMQLVGRLLYLMQSRCDLYYAVGVVSRYM